MNVGARDALLRAVADHSPELDAVRSLWRKYSATLGFFPDGAFSDYAQRGQVIAAVWNTTVVGYVLFRRTGTRAAIVHLCVDIAARGLGIARQLVDEVSNIAADADGVSLRCRRDFEADGMWLKLGFRPLRELRGRGRDGALLMLWFKSHGKDDLFSFAAKKQEPKTIAVVDANVFFDLAEAEERTANESRALLADWLEDILELKITRELFTEIARHSDAGVRHHNLEFARRFQVVTCDPASLEATRRCLAETLPPPSNARDRSDREHLAMCIASGTRYFVTRDELLREYAEPLWARTKVDVLRPSELIANLDELERAEAYRPVSFAGTRMRLAPAKELPELHLADTFRGSQRRAEFLAVLRAHIAAPRTYSSQVVIASESPVALLSRARASDGTLEVPLMRVAGADSRTLASYLAHQVQTEAVEHNAPVVVIRDSGLDAITRGCLQADDFAFGNGTWLKAVCPLVGTRDDLRAWAASARSRASRPDVAAFLAGVEQDALDRSPAAIERLLWPAKLLDSALSTFVVPVRAHWAQHLFDAELATLELFGAQPHLAMSRENVYYRAPTNPATLPSPARLLWYVSADPQKPGTRSIRACSRLVEVSVGPPKPVYKAGRRLGIYEWKDVERIARASRDGQVQLLRFCDTESFRTPVPLETVHAILDQLGEHTVNRSLPGPQRISENAFAAIYRAGRRAPGEASVP